MTIPVLCPDSSQWRRLLLDEVAEGEAPALEQHLEQCSACRAKLRELQAGDFDLYGPDGTHVTGQVCERFREHRAHSGEETIAGESTPDGDAEFFGFLDPPQASDELGRMGRFRVLEVLGWGGMGVVFRAEGPGHSGSVALKVIRPALALTSSARQRFRREAETAAALRHEHIVTVSEVGEDRGLPYLVMPLLCGETLEDRLRRDGCLPMDDVAQLGRQVALGLAAAHDLGLVHRDIKPANIWLQSPDSQVKILDFGLVRAADECESMSRVGQISGTPAYMSPEQAQGDEIDNRADLFSLGGLLYRAATGQAPFQGRNAAAILLAVVRDDPPPPAALNPLVPARLSDLVMSLLEKNPLHRPASARFVADLLAAIAPPPMTPPAVPRTFWRTLVAWMRRRGKGHSDADPISHRRGSGLSDDSQ